MKALQLLDHVMLWGARGFSGILLAMACFNLWQSVRPHQFNPQVSPVDIGVIEVVVSGLLSVSLWHFHLLVLKCFLGLISALALVALSITLPLIDSEGDVSGLDYFYYYSLFLGFVSFLWIAFRSPKSPNFPHSVNSVCLP